jgi:hypothetical protein
MTSEITDDISLLEDILRNYDSIEIFILASKYGCQRSIKYMMKHDYYISEQSLILAAGSGDIGIMKILNKCAYMNVFNIHNITWACNNGEYCAIRYILSFHPET